MEPTTIAEFWDCELEHSEAKQSWVNEHLLQVIRRTLGTNAPRNLDVEAELRKMAESQAIQTEWAINDKILTFEDRSRLALVAMDANTMKGSSRVMAPDEQNIKTRIDRNADLNESAAHHVLEADSVISAFHVLEQQLSQQLRRRHNPLALLTILRQIPLRLPR